MGSYIGGLRTGTAQAGKDAVDAAKTVRMKKDMINQAFGSSPSPAATTEPVNPGSPADRVNPRARFGSRPGEKRIDTNGMTKPLGSFKKGGKVKKTGVYNLHKGERVLNVKQTKKLKGLAKGLSK